MQWPDWFPTSLPLDRINSARWRGLAILGRRSNTAGQTDSIDPVSGTRFTDRDVASHVLIKPHKVAAATATGTLVAAQPGIRYYVHSIEIGYGNLAAGTSTGLTVSGTIGGVATVLCRLVIQPLLLASGNISFQPDVLLDTNTAITAASVTADSTNMGFIVSYSEVGSSA